MNPNNNKNAYLTIESIGGSEAVANASYPFRVASQPGDLSKGYGKSGGDGGEASMMVRWGGVTIYNRFYTRYS